MGDSAREGRRPGPGPGPRAAVAAAAGALAIALAVAVLLASRSSPGSPVAAAASAPCGFSGSADRRAPPPPPPAAAGQAVEKHLLPVPVFKQWDPAWGDDPLGPTREPLRFAGCAVCCVAMSFRHFGMEVTPGGLNRWLTRNGGYTARGWIRWEKCAEFASGRAALQYQGPPDLPRIDASLAAGNPAIVKVLLPGGIAHWVLVVGREGGEYLVNDPLSAEPEPARLSSYGGSIHALRIFRKR